MIVFDTTVLLLVLDPHVKPPNDPATGRPLERAAERIEHLVSTLSKANERIIIPTPVFSEVLVLAGAAVPRYIQHLNGMSVFRIAPFDQRAAIEAALAHADAINRGGIKIDAANPDTTKTKIKFDRQIVAIAKVEGARMIYSDDEGLIKSAHRSSISTCRTSELDLPPEDPQQSLNFIKRDD